MAFLSWLLRRSRRGRGLSALPPRDCRDCWKARAYAGFWGRGTCRSCGKVHGRLFSTPIFSGIDKRER